MRRLTVRPRYGRSYQGCHCPGTDCSAAIPKALPKRLMVKIAWLGIAWFRSSRSFFAARQRWLTSGQWVQVRFLPGSTWKALSPHDETVTTKSVGLMSAIWLANNWRTLNLKLLSSDCKPRPWRHPRFPRSEAMPPRVAQTGSRPPRLPTILGSQRPRSARLVRREIWS